MRLKRGDENESKTWSLRLFTDSVTRISVAKFCREISRRANLERTLFFGGKNQITKRNTQRRMGVYYLYLL